MGVQSIGRYLTLPAVRALDNVTTDMESSAPTSKPDHAQMTVNEPFSCQAELDTLATIKRTIPGLSLIKPNNMESQIVQCQAALISLELQVNDLVTGSNAMYKPDDRPSAADMAAHYLRPIVLLLNKLDLDIATLVTLAPQLPPTLAMKIAAVCARLLAALGTFIGTGAVLKWLASYQQAPTINSMIDPLRVAVGDAKRTAVERQGALRDAATLSEGKLKAGNTTQVAGDFLEDLPSEIISMCARYLDAGNADLLHLGQASKSMQDRVSLDARRQLEKGCIDKDADLILAGIAKGAMPDDIGKKFEINALGGQLRHMTAMELALERNDFKLANKLLSKGAPISSPKFVTAEGIILQAPTRFHSSQLISARFLQHLLNDAAAMFCEIRTNARILGAQDGEGNTVLHHVAIYDFSDAMRPALELVLSVDAWRWPDTRNMYGRTALHYAVEKNDFQYAKQLLDIGADPSLRGGPGDFSPADHLSNFVKGRELQLVQLWHAGPSQIDERARDEHRRELRRTHTEYVEALDLMAHPKMTPSVGFHRFE